MKRSTKVFGAAFSFAAMPVFGAELLAQMPVQFQGHWNANVQLCGRGGETRLEIRANEIRFYESAGKIVAIVAQGANELVLVAELSGEGQKWLSAVHFQLSEDKRELRDISTPTPFVRRRCP